VPGFSTVMPIRLQGDTGWGSDRSDPSSSVLAAPARFWRSVHSAGLDSVLLWLQGVERCERCRMIPDRSSSVS
jgi:hypothetical protein